MYRTTLLVAIAMAGGATAARAQSETENMGGVRQVSGRVFDNTTGCPLHNVKIAAMGAKGGAMSDANGRYHLKGLPDNPVTLMATRAGYDTRETDSVMVSDADVRVDFSLMRSAGSSMSTPHVAYPSNKCALEPQSADAGGPGI